MKTVAKIDPEKEYENAKKLIEVASQNILNFDNVKSLGSSVDNLMTAARVLMEREERRRGHKKTPPKENKSKGRKQGEGREDVKKLPSERFPRVEIEEKTISPANIPICPCCNKQMKESGLFDVSEKLEIIPKKYYIERNKRPKFNCSNCHGSMVNTPAVPSIIPTSNYGDSLIIDVALSKYCDLIPIERYVQIAFRNGLKDLPPQSLIGVTHILADFLLPIYEKLKKEIMSSSVVQIDETTHRMLEGDETRNWYLWGYFSQIACVFEAHNTRSGDVVFNFLKDSQTIYLLSDGYSGYGKAIKDIKKIFNRDIVEANCNAHAYRYFKDASIIWKTECTPFLALYGEIYELERRIKEQGKKLSATEQLDIRRQMLPLFEKIKENCEKNIKDVMPESLFKKSINYFLNHYSGLVLCTKNIDIPLDNNLAERELRAPVIGRKIWLGTHSKRGAETASVLFSIVHSCKINNINPRNYFPWVIERIHAGETIYTPHQYSKFHSSD